MDKSDREILELSYKDPGVFSILFDRYSKLFISVVRRDSLENDRIDDCVQETFIRIYKYGRGFLQKDGDFKKWAYTILRNVVNDELSKNKLIYPISEEIENTLGSEEQFKEYESFDYVRSILDKMENSFAQVLRLKFILGKSSKQISKILGISNSAVRVRVHRAKRIFFEISQKNNLYGKQ